jgi:hypothetical protein
MEHNAHLPFGEAMGHNNYRVLSEDHRDLYPAARRQPEAQLVSYQFPKPLLFPDILDGK